MAVSTIGDRDRNNRGANTATSTTTEQSVWSPSRRSWGLLTVDAGPVDGFVLAEQVSRSDKPELAHAGDVTERLVRTEWSAVPAKRLQCRPGPHAHTVFVRRLEGADPCPAALAVLQVDLGCPGAELATGILGNAVRLGAHATIPAIDLSHSRSRSTVDNREIVIGSKATTLFTTLRIPKR
jgi:hypothetical protein